MKTSRCLLTGWALIGWLQWHGHGSACGVCFNLGGNPFTLPHPKAIEIAVATRSALDKGLIGKHPAAWDRTPILSGQNRSSIPQSWDRRAQTASLSLLKQWSETLQATKTPSGSNSLTVHVVLVDTSEACAIHFRGGRAVLEPRPRGPADSVVATTLPGLQALVARDIGLDEAMKLGLLFVEGGDTLYGALKP